MRDGKQKIFLIASGIMLAFVCCYFIWFINARIDYLIDSDDSSELILGHLLASENCLLSKNWYYSTELRVVNTQIFYAFFFKIFHSWHKVRIASYICLYMVMLAAYYFMCRGLKNKKYFLITAVLLMLPFSEGYFLFVLKGAYYIPYIAITFFTLGLCESYVNEMHGRGKIYLTIAFLCAVLACMGGARQIVILYIPLVLTAMGIVEIHLSIDEENVICNLTIENKKYILFSVVSFAGAILGYIVNTKVLANFFLFMQWDDISFTDFDISKLSQIINVFLSSYGYTTGKVFSFVLLSNFLCVCWLIFTVGACIYILKNPNRVSPAHCRLALFTIAAFITFILLYMFTDLSYVDRYNIPIIVLSIPMIAILFKNMKVRDTVKDTVIMTFVLLVTLSGYLFCQSIYKADYTEELRNIVAVLEDGQYTEGYATFWRANILTELSNGNIDVRDWQYSNREGDYPMTVTSIDDTYKWLQLTAHDYTHPTGKVFLLFTINEWENNPWKGKLSTEHIIYQSDNYMVIGYDTYEKLRQDTDEW